ncbi:MAG: SDR family NAD(P)-dependent oxidoreductase, partial [Phormidesmis sp. CAN_BIN36]|nr:SDR family NAD(P)-dependent oxidoreductase [Phormidesmis sp. CAN_BIN36]
MTLNSERRALITGASSGIGKATALAFAEAGIHLALVSRSQPQLEAVAETARKFGVKVQVYPIDLSKVAEVRSQIEAIAAFSPLDILINNAGMGYTGSLMEMSLTDWQRVIDLNVTSVLQCIQGVLPRMRERKQGTIINVASIAAHQTFPNWGAY